MSRKADALLLAACRESGMLALRDLFVEVDLFAPGKEFTAAELARMIVS